MSTKSTTVNLWAIADLPHEVNINHFKHAFHHAEDLYAAYWSSARLDHQEFTLSAHTITMSQQLCRHAYNKYCFLVAGWHWRCRKSFEDFNTLFTRRFMDISPKAYHASPAPLGTKKLSKMRHRSALQQYNWESKSTSRQATYTIFRSGCQYASLLQV